MTLVLGLWVAGCSTPSTNHSPSDDFGGAYSLSGQHLGSGNLDIHKMQRALNPKTYGYLGTGDFADGDMLVIPAPAPSHSGTQGSFDILGQRDHSGSPDAPGQIVIVDEQSEGAFNRNSSWGNPNSRHAANGTNETIRIVGQRDHSGSPDAPGKIVIVDEQSDGAVTRNKSWGGTGSRHADRGTNGTQEEIIVMNPNLESTFLGQGFLSMTNTQDDGEAMNIFIAQLPSDTSVEHVPDRLMLFAEDPNHMVVADARNGQDLRYKGNTSDSEVVSPEPTKSINGNIYFAFNSWKLSDPMVETLIASAKWLKTHEGTKIMIEGHCDERGSREYNVVLGEKRASVVKSFLRDLGVQEDQIVTISYGKERPVCLEGSATCHAKNRRALIQEM